MQCSEQASKALGSFKKRFRGPSGPPTSVWRRSEVIWFFIFPKRYHNMVTTHCDHRTPEHVLFLFQFNLLPLPIFIQLYNPFKKPVVLVCMWGCWWVPLRNQEPASEWLWNTVSDQADFLDVLWTSWSSKKQKGLKITKTWHVCPTSKCLQDMKLW